MQAATLAMFAAAGIAMCSAGLGVGMARLLWAQDLRQAQEIDAIRSRTEVALRGRIKIMEKRLGEEP